MADPANTGIYEIVNLVNGKRYVGSAVNLSARWVHHRARLRSGKHYNRHLQSSWNKHGEECFAFRVIDLCSPEDLICREQASIDKLRPEMNVCPKAGSTLGRLHSEETRRKIGAKKVGIKMPPRSAETRAKLSAVHKGRPKTPEHLAALQDGRSRQVFSEDRRQRVSESLKAAYADGRKSRERSPEYREKIAAKLRERFASPEAREYLRHQATKAWADRSEHDKRQHMEHVRSARGPMTAEQRRNISERQRGKARPAHVMEALRAANVGRTQNAEERARKSRAMKDWYTPERRRARSEALKRAWAKRKSTAE